MALADDVDSTKVMVAAAASGGTADQSNIGIGSLRP
jgi:hypothetical protein